MESTLTRSTLCGALDESARYISNSLPEYSSDQGKTAAPASPFIRGEDLHDEAVNADTECDDPDDQAIPVPHPSFCGVCHGKGCDADSRYEESYHHYEGSSDSTRGDASMPPTASGTQFSHVRPSRAFNHQFAEPKYLDANGASFQTMYFQEVEQPASPVDILKVLRRHGGGKATCLWMRGGHGCGYSSHVDLVKRHIKRVHFRVKPCTCEHCGRKFFNRYALSLHHNSHTGARPFTCNFCGKGFSSPSGKSHHHVNVHKYRVLRRSADDSLDGDVVCE